MIDPAPDLAASVLLPAWPSERLPPATGLPAARNARPPRLLHGARHAGLRAKPSGADASSPDAAPARVRRAARARLPARTAPLPLRKDPPSRVPAHYGGSRPFRYRR